MSAFQETWGSMTTGSRVGVSIGAGLILLVALVSAIWVFGSKYETLFTSLESRDAASVIAELEKMQVPFEIAEGGASILVPAESVHELRLKLMGSGVPLHGGVGFEIFDNSDFGMTEFAQKINYQRALEGELTRTIISLQEVKFARVHLVLPENSLFRQGKNEPTASVTLFMKDGAMLSPKKISGVQRMVSASVPGLDMAGVTVADQNGVTLSRKTDEEEGSGAVSTRLEKKREVESYLSAKATEVLDKAFGVGQAIVSVNVSLNMDQKRTTREEVISNDDAKSDVVRKRESRTGSSGTQKGKGTDVVTEVEYKLGRQVEQIVMTPGDIEQLSVGVLVPRAMAADRIDEIRTLVSMAVGLNTDRGDAVSVFLTDAPVVVNAVTDAVAAPVVMDDVTTKTETIPKFIDKFLDIKNWTQQQLMIGGALLLLVLGLFLYLLFSGRKQSRRLAPAERERVLKQLNTWLEQSPEKAAAEVKS